MEIVTIEISKLFPDAANLRHHGNENIEMIKRSLKENGQYRPIIVDSATMIVKIGNGRLQAMKELGWKECLCVLTDFTNHQGMEVLDNRLNELSRWNDEGIDDWLLNDKGIDWWGVDSMKSVTLFDLSKKKEREEKKKENEQPKEKKGKPQKVCPCCGKPVTRKKAILL